MSKWELWSKRILKGAIWAATYVAFALCLGLEPTWRLLLLVIACSMVNDILNAIWPTQTSANREPQK